MTSRYSVLLVDDNHDMLDLLEIFLYREYDIITALNGFEATTIAKDRRPDCIITDIMMPGMDGIRFLNTLREYKETAHIPVLALTAFTKDYNIVSLLNIGFARVITKPIERHALVESIKVVIDESRKQE